MSTLKDLARNASVSVCTVSRYLNHKIVVKQETAARIERAIKELGYVPNMVAQSLKRNSTSNIAVILPKLHPHDHTEMISGISQELASCQYHLFLCEVENLKKTEEEVLQTMRENMVAGVIFVGHSSDMSFSQSLRYLQAWDVPVVYTNRVLPYTGFPLVYPNFLKAGWLAGEHLISRGKHRLALVHSAASDSLISSHVEGFRQAAAAAGLQPPVILQIQSGLVPSWVNLIRLLQRDVDGVLSLDEMVTAGLVKALVKNGLSIPKQIAVLGFGNSIIGEITEPALSCIDLQNKELGIQSAKLLLHQIDGENVDPVTVLAPFIVQRAST